MKILITGVTGLLGSCLTKTCYENGYEVVGLHRRSGLDKSFFGFPITLHFQDLSSDDWDPEIFKDVDVVAHCAADTNMRATRSNTQNQINVKATKKLVSLSERYKVKRFILISTANTIKPGTKNDPGNENEKCSVSDSLLPYVNSKIESEEIVRASVKNNGLNAIILNPTFIIGPSPGGISSNELIELALYKKIAFYPAGSKNLVDIRDICTAIISSINNGATGENYLLCNENISYQNIFKYIRDNHNKNALLIPIPKFLLTVVGLMGTFFESVTGLPARLNHKSAFLLNSNNYYSNDKARKELGFKPRNYKVTIEDYIKETM